MPRWSVSRAPKALARMHKAISRLVLLSIFGVLNGPLFHMNTIIVLMALSGSSGPLRIAWTALTGDPFLILILILLVVFKLGRLLLLIIIVVLFILIVVRDALEGGIFGLLLHNLLLLHVVILLLDETATPILLFEHLPTRFLFTSFSV